MTENTVPHTTPNMDQVLALLSETHGPKSPVLNRIVAVEQANTELFDAAVALTDWLRTVPVQHRHIARFNRLQDALNGVREAHQMEPEHVIR